MSGIVARDENQATGVFVEAIDDAWTGLAADSREPALAGEAMQQCIHQRSSIACVFGRSRTGVDHHSCRLIDDGEVCVFVKYLKRNVFRDGAQWRGFRIAENGDGLA